MDDLIAKLEAATEGSRELDCAIAIAVGHSGFVAVVRYDHGTVIENDFPHYTTSLDAALTLAQPPGHSMWHWNIDAKLMRDHDFFAAEITVPSREFRGIQRTAALAMCIAALRARAAQ